MNRLVPAALAAMLLPLSACAGDDDGGSGGDGGQGGSAPRATGAVAMEVYATVDQMCPPGNVHINIGNVQSAPPQTVVDGEEGASVTCAVIPSGDRFQASGSIDQAGLSFSFSGVETDGTSTVGSVGFADPATGVRYESPASSPCVFQFAPGTEQGVSAGRIYVQFDCSALVSAQDPAESCSSRYGYVRLESCTAGP